MSFLKLTNPSDYNNSDHVDKVAYQRARLISHLSTKVPSTEATAKAKANTAIDQPATTSWSTKKKTRAGIPDAMVKITPITNPDIFPLCIAPNTQRNPSFGMAQDGGC